MRRPNTAFLWRLYNWLMGVPQIESDVDRLLELRETMSASEWLEIAEPYYRNRDEINAQRSAARKEALDAPQR